MNKQISIEKLTDAILAEFVEAMGAGAVARAVNVACQILEIETVKKVDGVEQTVLYQVTQQMMTNYGKNGMIDGIKREDGMTGVKFDQMVVRAFMIKFLNRRLGNVVVSGSRAPKVRVLADKVLGKLALTGEITEDVDETDENVDLENEEQNA